MNTEINGKLWYFVGDDDGIREYVDADGNHWIDTSGHDPRENLRKQIDNGDVSVYAF